MPNLKVEVEEYRFLKEYEENHQKNDKIKHQEDLPACPLCGELMIPGGGCFYCFNCGFSLCTD